jgi:hypothetical protein
MKPTYCAAVKLRAGEHTSFVEHCHPAPGDFWVWLTEPGEWMDLGVTRVRDWAEIPSGALLFASAKAAEATVDRHFKPNERKVIAVIPREELRQVGWAPRTPIEEKLT